MRRAIDHTLMSATALVAAVAGVVLIDERARRALSDVVTLRLSPELSQLGGGAMSLTRIVATAAAEQNIANAPLLIFVVIATVLMLFMVRT